MKSISKLAKRRHPALSPVLGLTHAQAGFVCEYLKDHNLMRAANASRVDVDEASLWISGDHAVRRAVDRIIAERLEEAEINLDWVLYELKDNHHLARQQGNLTASNKALDQLAKHKSIDAYAASKVDANVSGELGLSVTVKKYSNDGKVIEGAIVDEQGPKGINDERGAGGTQAGADAPVSFL